VAMARSAGGGRPLALALTASSMAALTSGRSDAPALAQEGQRVAAQSRDYSTFVQATVWLINATDLTADDPALILYRTGRRTAEDIGAPRTYLARLAAFEAGYLLMRGRWRECQDALRLAMSADAGTISDTSARLTAARLACRQGRVAESFGHLARAEELFAEQSGFLGLPFDAVRAELAVAAGQTDAAAGAALTGLSSEVLPDDSERLLPVAAQALADRAQRLRDLGRDPADALAGLDEIESRYPHVVGEPGDGPGWLMVLTAMQAWYDAERARAHAASPNWAEAAEACRVAGLPWDEAYCCWRVAESAAERRPAHRTTRDALRQAYRRASELQAAPLMRELEALAATVRVPLRHEPVAVPAGGGPAGRLTPREREVLGHLVAGRTYAETAAELFLSEKTVSVHVSNMLRKTGAANRIELIRRAGRTV
jgi:DNA-binding CsgD family transcriptional regulator